MAEATNVQMQSYSDVRIRVFAEHLRAVLIEAKDHKAAITDEYERAIGTSRWTDDRTDGPPHLLQSGNSANPDDLLNFNTFITDLIAFIETTKASEWGVLLRACVQPPLVS